MELAGIKPPEMDWNSSNLPEAWEKFERHVKLIFDGPFKAKTPEENISYLLLWIGDRGRDVHATWTLTDAERITLATHFTKFKDHVQPTLNPIFARYKFNNEVQGTDTIDAFVTRLRLAARDCQFSEHEKDNLVRDRIVFGTNSARVREKLINIGKDLKLEKAIQTAQAYEYSQEQLKSMGKDVDVCRSKSKGHNQRQRTTRGHTNPSATKTRPRADHRTDNKHCGNCGKSHKAGQCPAKGKQCYHCDKFNHFSSCCRARNVTVKNNVNCVSDNSDFEDNVREFKIDTVSTFSPDRAFVNLTLLPSQTPVKFKIDTGSLANIIPLRQFRSLHIQNPLQPAEAKLTSYTGNDIPVLGQISLKCKYRDKSVNALFQVVDTTASALISLDTSIKLGLIQMTYAVDIGYDKQTVMEQYADLFKGTGVLPGTTKLHLKPDATPVVNPPRRVPEALKGRLKVELQRMQDSDIIAKVDEPTDWVNSLVVVEKPKTGDLRICLDPKALNQNIRRPHYPMPTLDDVTSQLSGAKYFSILDITHAYWSVRLDDESSYLTTFSSPFGRYRFLRMPFGLSCSQDIFQRKVNETFEGLTGVSVIVDDILIHGRSRQEHDERLRDVLERAKAQGVRFNPNKCKIGVTEVPFFGHLITDKGLKADPSKVQAILDLEIPDSRAKLESLLGVIGYLSKFAKNLSEVTAPLRSLLKQENEFVWDQPQNLAFQKVKSIITSTPVLGYFDPNETLTIECDASKHGIGTCIMQHGQPIAYASKSLTDAEINYAVIEKECLALLFACKRFHQYTYGNKVKVRSDHKPLEAIMKKPLSAAPPRLQRMLLQLQIYDLDVTHVSGKDMLISDCLSRQSLKNTYPDLIQGLDLHVHTVLKTLCVTDRRLSKIKQAVKTDKQMTILKQTILDGWPDSRSKCSQSVQEYFNHRDELSVEADLIFRGHKLIIPHSQREEILSAVHVGHMGVEKTLARARDAIFWPGMTKDITDHVLQCAICLKHRNSNQKEPLLPHDTPDRPYQKVGTDIFTFDGKDYLVTVDYYSRFFEVDMLPDMKSSTVIRKLKVHFSRNGIPDVCISDNGPQFSSELFSEFAEEWGFEHSTSSPLHAMSNGMAERTVQTVKRLFRKAKDSKTDPYIAILEYRNMPLECGYTPAQLLMGRQTRSIIPVVADRLKPQTVDSKTAKSKMNQSKVKQKTHFDKTAKQLPPISLNDSVRIQMGKIWKPAIVVKVHNDRSFSVQTEDGGVYRRNRRLLHKSKESFPQISPFDPNVVQFGESPAAELHKPVSLQEPPSSETDQRPISCNLDPGPDLSTPSYTTRSGRIVQASKKYSSDEWTK